MEEVLFDRIITETFTTGELRRRLPILKDYFEKKLFGATFMVPKDIEPADYTWLLLLINAYEKRADSALRTITQDSVTKIFAELEAKVATITPVIVFLSTVLPSEEIANLGRALRKAFGKKLFMEVRFDPLLIGGAAFAWKGIYKDFSVRQKIRDNQDAILKSFQKYTQK